MNTEALAVTLDLEQVEREMAHLKRQNQRLLDALVALLDARPGSVEHTAAHYGALALVTEPERPT